MAKEDSQLTDTQPSDDYRHIDTLDERLREERPDELIDRGDNRQGKFDDPETDAVGDEHPGVLSDENDSTAEEAALNVADEAPGATNSDTDSYTGDKI
jgi:hypothetical protein